MQNNKFQVFEIVNVVNARENCNFFLDQLGQIVNIHFLDKIVEYDIFLYDFGSLYRFPEADLESTGCFLNDEEIAKRKAIASIKSKYSLYEIVEINKHKNPSFIGRKGFIWDMDISYNTEVWEYRVLLLDNINDYIWVIDDDISSCNQLLSLEEVDKIQAKKITDSDCKVDLEEIKKWQAIVNTIKVQCDNSGQAIYTPIMFGLELKKRIFRREDVANFGYWAYSVYSLQRDTIDKDYEDLLFTLSFMSEGPEFERTYKELNQIADDLLYGKNINLSSYMR